MADWPDASAARSWMDAEGIPSDDPRVPEALAGVIGQIKGRLDPDLNPVDGDDDYPVAPEVRMATLIQTARIFSRKDSPTGIVGEGEFQVRVSKIDPDVTDMMTNRVWQSIVLDFDEEA